MFKIVDRFQMCSTLVVGGWPSPEYCSTGQYKKKLITFLKEQVTNSEGNAENNYTLLWSQWEIDRKLKQHNLDGHFFSDFAFVVGSIFDSENHIENGHYYDWTDDDGGWNKKTFAVFEELGFTVSEPVFNEKNGTTIRMVSISVPLLLKTLSLYDKDGNLIGLKKERAA